MKNIQYANCTFCNRRFKKQGIGRHEAYCKFRKELRVKEQESGPPKLTVFDHAITKHILREAAENEALSPLQRVIKELKQKIAKLRDIVETLETMGK